ncbi:SRF-type transcription factor [Oesophagostomum dentatum]|uniref:Serum response factor homolog n=1 Tax=Oesophagostomum dentatum TaxID=61180 RepID=A0A0B1SRS2_OESDE|nr:SRF-type transcription factor [Oesophagostomum dentatum]
MEDSPELAQLMHHLQSSSSTSNTQPSLPESTSTPGLLPNGKKTKGRVKIKMEYIGNKLRRYTTFSKRKTGIMKKAYELSTLTGTQVMLLVASETGHVYTYATKKLQPMISSDTGKALIQTCLNAPGDGSDLQPNRTEFTFETGTAPPNPRKRRAADTPDATQTLRKPSIV